MNEIQRKIEELEPELVTVAQAKQLMEAAAALGARVMQQEGVVIIGNGDRAHGWILAAGYEAASLVGDVFIWLHSGGDVVTDVKKVH